MNQPLSMAALGAGNAEMSTVPLMWSSQVCVCVCVWGADVKMDCCCR